MRQNSGPIGVCNLILLMTDNKADISKIVRTYMQNTSSDCEIHTYIYKIP